MSAHRLFASPALGDPARRAFWTLVAIGTVVRLVVAFATAGTGFDIESWRLVREALSTAPLDVYSTVNEPNAPHFPYPPGFFAWIVLSGWLHDLTGLRYDGFVQVAPIAADAAIAWVVQAFLGQCGASDRTRIAAAALVALGPSFGLISGYTAQIDSLVILPALLGVWAWLRADPAQRALLAGLLIGLGGSVKVPALLVVLALLPTARSLREAATLGATAAAVPLLMLSPWLLADPDGTVGALRSNDGLPGFGGISLLVQPGLSALWLGTRESVGLTPASEWLFDRASLFAIGSLLTAGAVLLWRRTPPVLAGLVVYLTFYAFGINFGVQYLIWGLPFALLAGRLVPVAALQAALIVPTAIGIGLGPEGEPLHYVYTPIMLLVWAGLVAWWAVEMREVLRGERGRQGLTATRPV